MIKRLAAGFINLLNWQKQRPFQLIVDAFQLKRRIVQACPAAGLTAPCPTVLSARLQNLFRPGLRLKSHFVADVQQHRFASPAADRKPHSRPARRLSRLRLDFLHQLAVGRLKQSSLRPDFLPHRQLNDLARLSLGA